MEWTGLVETPIHASQVYVQEIHDVRRDAVMVNFPSFQTSGQFEHGMSGGPIVSARTGGVVGIVSSAFDGDTKIAYGALIGGLIEVGIELRDDNGQHVTLRMDELLGQGLVMQNDGATCKLDRREESVRLSWPRDRTHVAQA